ncbi:TIM barrel protein [Brooklawnia cerclae]|nr:TIM barrel protein [Brooklawnia cerclae]
MNVRDLSVNCSILLTHLPLLARPAAAREAGFEAIELWWPFASATPSDDEIDALVRALRDAGVQLAGLNFAAGDMAAGDRGLMSWPGREAELRANLDAVTMIGEQTGCRLFNALYGLRRPDSTPEIQDALAAKNLALAAQAVGRIGGTVLVEPVSGAPEYPLRTADDVVAVLDRVTAQYGAKRLGLLFDVYHLAANGDDVDAAIASHANRIAHVQIADLPGRGAPGTGRLPIARWLDDLRQRGYTGRIALEYVANNSDPFAWLAQF